MGRNTRTRRSITLAVLLATGLATAGCQLAETAQVESMSEEERIGDVVTAIPQAEPRIVEVADAETHLDGFSYTLTLWLETDTAVAFTPDELNRVLVAVFDSLEWQPSTVTIQARTESGEEPDMSDAASQLGIRTNDSSVGLALMELDDLYGK